MKRLIIGAVVASVLITVPVVMATGGNDGNTLNAAMKIKAVNSGSVSFTVASDTLAGGILSTDPGNALTTDGHAVKVTCAVSTTAVPLLSTTYTGTATVIGAPKFTSCTNNVKPRASTPTPPATQLPPGSCTAPHTGPCSAAVGTSGVWTSTYVDNGSESGAEVPGAGDSISIQGAKDDVLSLSGSALECLILGNPNGTDGPAVGSYNDSSGLEAISGATLSFTVVQNPKFPTKKGYPACSIAGDTGTAHFDGSYQLAPILHDS